MVNRFIILILLALYPSGCIKVTPTPDYPDYNVFALLRYGIDTQEVFVDYVYKPGDSILPGIYDAIVSVSTKDTVIFYEPHLTDTMVLFRAPSGDWIQPEQDYTLTVEIVGGDLIKARTTIPGEFHILYPDEYDTVDTNTPLLWTSSRHAFYYIASVIPLDTSVTPPPFHIPMLTRDTVLYRFVYPFYFQREGNYLLSIEAIDSSYFRYLSYEESNLENAMGVFGGAVVKELILYYGGGLAQ